MSIFSRLAGRLRGMFFHRNSSEIGRAFGVELITSQAMRSAIDEWNKVISGTPSWIDKEDGIETINMAKHISRYRAKLTTLDINIAVSGSARADFIQTVADDLLRRLPEKVSEADGLGGMIFRWNGNNWDYVLHGEFGVTAKDSNGNITGAIFANHLTQGKYHYTRLEYHRFENDVYRISNKAFRNIALPNGNYSLGTPVALESVNVWKHLQPEVSLLNLEKPLFAYYRVPGANTVDPSSPLGLSVFENALTELKDIDIAISRKNQEVEDSKHITFVGQAALKGANNQGIKLPRYVLGLGVGADDAGTKAVHEHAPTLLTGNRIADINFDLSMAGVKCGFSEGVFVLDGQTGMITATQVEADDRDTIQTIKDERDALQDAIEQALYGVDVMATLYGLAPVGVYEATYKFGDITYSYEEDRGRWLTYAIQGRIPFWYYLVKFEGLTEEEAKELGMAAKQETAEEGLFMQQILGAAPGGEQNNDE